MPHGRGNAGYSLSELIILFILVALVTGFVVWNWDKFSGKPAAKTIQTEAADVETIVKALGHYAAQRQAEGRTPVYPLELDAAPVGAESSDETPLFTAIIDGGVRSGWAKIGVNQYVYASGQHDRTDMREVYSYDPDTGVFRKSAKAKDAMTRRAPPGTRAATVFL